jgi:hypothetical protein
MNAEIKKLWVDALKSSEFQQTSQVLKNADGYCCLGVLSELHRRENPGVCDWFPVSNSYGECFSYRRSQDDNAGSPFLLTHTVCKWAGLNDGNDNPRVPYGQGTFMLSELNDGEQSWDIKRPVVPFTEIADIIEKSL